MAPAKHRYARARGTALVLAMAIVRAPGAVVRALRRSIDLADVFVFGGLALAGYGLHAIYPPAAFIVVGVALFWLGVRS